MPNKKTKRDDDHVPTAAEISQRLDRAAAQQERNETQQEKNEKAIDRLVAEGVKTEKTIDQLAKQIGRVDKIFGDMAEYVSFHNLERLLQEQAGIAIKGVGKRFKLSHQGKNYEFDLIAPGTRVVVVIEVKTTLRSDDVSNFAAIMPKFTAVCPEYEKRDVYGGFAYMKAQDGAEASAHKHGMLTIRAIGGSTSQLVGFDKNNLRNFRQ